MILQIFPTNTTCTISFISFEACATKRSDCVITDCPWVAVVRICGAFVNIYTEKKLVFKTIKLSNLTLAPPKQTNNQTKKKNFIISNGLYPKKSWMIFGYYCWGVRLTVMVMKWFLNLPKECHKVDLVHRYKSWKIPFWKCPYCKHRYSVNSIVIIVTIIIVVF